MKYVSTRGKAKELGFVEVVTSGLASDGGLYVPSYIPEFSPTEIRAGATLVILIWF
jgi:threonine synthase